jgi:hypothetical protein
MEDQVRRTIMIALIALLALAMAAPTVLARNVNGVAPTDASGSIVVNPGDFPGSCDFPFRLDFSGKAKTIDRPGDVFIFTSPDLNVTVTNLENGKQATFNITGTLEQTTLANGDVVTVARGRNFLIDPEAGTVIAIGDFSFVFNAKGELIQPLEGEGQLIDVCAALQ